ncbi:MAG: 4-alpha-glucanotransferase [Paludibacteraceae bacterium]|nr:4-alpha-glucanotransferase [Paludibacteraceae bacterium]
MNVHFQINYRTVYGQELCLIQLGDKAKYTEAQPLFMSCHGQDCWVAEVSLPAGSFAYKYAIHTQEGFFIYESGNNREIELRAADKQIFVHDYWQSVDYEKAFYTTAFLKSLFRRTPKSGQLKAAASVAKSNVRFSIDLPQILPCQGVAIMGNIPELGNWDEKKKVVMDDHNFPVWRANISVKANEIFEYKYVVYDKATDKIVDLEYGENRHVWGVQKGVVVLQNDRSFRRTQPRWKGAGVAVPVFSLRTEEGFGIGEYQDLKKMAEWAVMTGMKIIQTLPINDTTLTHTNLDSYPYSPVSVFALHPIYINIEKMGKLTPAQRKKYEATKKEFNAKSFADYQVVYDEKMKYFKAIFKAEKEAVFASTEYKTFFDKNKTWLEPYAAFMAKRDKQTKDFYYFLQYHADRQLADAVAYAHSIGVAMKGDIPIGINPNSVDAYENPELFNLKASAGAPPDDFDARGQNWGFPTYNWDVMAKDNYDWWKRRFGKMADYFDAYRIDHILGMFRIWQMRKTDVWGLCGHFCPALPYSLQDLWNMGVKLDEDRMTKPYIRSNFLGDVFGFDTDYAKEKFLLTNDGYVYYFRPEFDTQVKVQEYFEKGEGKNLPEGQRVNLMNGLIYLHCEVLFVRDQKNDNLLHPRISIYQSHSFNELYQDQKDVIMGIYNDYFFHRHNDFWRGSAMSKIPTLINSTGMLCCGEDLGMVPECVPQVMHELQILSLEIQRMPKDPTILFAHPADAPYLSVCTTGTHDTNPLRAWWEEDREKTQRFYNEQMGWWGEAPQEMTPEIAEFIINQHMYSPAMWAILPLQDWLAIDGEVRIKDVHADRINLPSNPRHFWNYRMHISVEDLKNQVALNEKIKKLTSVR